MAAELTGPQLAPKGNFPPGYTGVFNKISAKLKAMGLVDKFAPNLSPEDIQNAPGGMFKVVSDIGNKVLYFDSMGNLVKAPVATSEQQKQTNIVSGKTGWKPPKDQAVLQKIGKVKQTQEYLQSKGKKI